MTELASTVPAATIAAAALEDWTTAVLMGAGAPPGPAGTAAHVLAEASLRGIDSHGVARLPAYVSVMERGLVDLDAKPAIERRDGATAVVDAGNGLGAPAGEFAAGLASDLADEHGVGWVVVRRSNHFGIAGHYVRLAAGRGHVGLAATNSAATVAPTRARNRFLGTNPLAFGVPVKDADPLVLDMSTSTVSGGKLEVAMREDRPIPEGWGVDAAGRPTTDPAKVFRGGGALSPLGGSELTSSHKGYGLGLMVEILCAVFAAGATGPRVGALTSSAPQHEADISHFFAAVDPACFAGPEGFTTRMAELVAELRGLPPVDPALPVLVPGDDEVDVLARRRATGVPLDTETAVALRALGARLGLPLPEGA